jgi:hypothetical protein
VRCAARSVTLRGRGSRFPGGQQCCRRLWQLWRRQHTCRLRRGETAKVLTHAVVTNSATQTTEKTAAVVGSSTARSHARGQDTWAQGEPRRRARRCGGAAEQARLGGRDDVRRAASLGIS